MVLGTRKSGKEPVAVNPNEDFLSLMVDLPADVERRAAAGDLDGARRLIARYLDGPCGAMLAARLRTERVRLDRVEQSYRYDRPAALALLRDEWPDCTEEQFNALVDAGRIDWRYVNGQERFLASFVDALRLYPKEAPGLKREKEDHTERDQILARMEEQGEVSACITLKATIRSDAPAGGKKVLAWLPFPARRPQQSGIELLSATPGYVLAPEDAPARTICWESEERDSFEVTYRYRFRAEYIDPLSLPWDGSRPQFYTGEWLPHIAFTPYLRELAEGLTKKLYAPAEKAWAIYQWVTENVDYRYQPAYVLLNNIADNCAKERRGDCGVMALLFITLCRIAGVPAKWQSGLAVRPGHAGCHDWCMFYAAPYGWLYADPSFGSGARRDGEEGRRKHYFGSLDPWRMVANSAFQTPLAPPDPCLRHDPYDNQLGEMAVDGVGLTSAEMTRTVETVEFQYL